MASRFWVLGTGTWDASDTSHWASVSNGAPGATVPGSADSVTMDAASGGGTVTVNTNIGIVSLTTGAFTGTLDFSANNNTVALTGAFSNTGTGTRTVNCGGGQWTLSNNAATVWSCGDLSNCTFTPPSLPVNFTYAGAVGTRTITHGNTLSSGTETNAPSIRILGGTDIISHGSGSVFKSINYTGFSGTVASVSITIYGNLTTSATATYTGGAQIFSFLATSGTQLITTNGAILDRAVTVNNPGATVKFQDGWIGSTRTFIFTQGTVDDNGQTLNFGIFSSAVSNTRNLTLAGTWNIGGSGTTVWNTNVLTGFTLTQTGTINFTYSGSVGTRTVQSASSVNGATEANAFSIKITAGTDILAISTSRVFKTVDFTGFGGSWTPTAQTFYGGLILNTTMTVVSAAVILTFSATSGTYNITTAENTGFSSTVTLNAPGGTYQLGSAFISGRAFTHTAGTFNTQNFNLTALSFNSNNSNVRTINLGSSTITVTGTGIAWSTAVTTNLTFNAGTSTIVLNDSSATEKEIATDVITFNNLYFTGGGTGDLFIRPFPSPVTFNNIRVDPGMIVKFFGGSTTNVTSLTIIGGVGDLITLQSSGAGVKWTLNSTTGIPLTVQYASIQDSTASPPSFIAYSSVDVSNNVGWLFKPLSLWTDVPKPSNTTVLTQEGTPIGLLLALTYATSNTTVKGWTGVTKPSGTSWTDINKPSGTTWSNVN